jgi:hypothetical protein
MQRDVVISNRRSLMSRVARTCALLALAVLSLATVAGSAAGSSPRAHAAGSCHLSTHDQRNLGASYVTSLSVSHVSCSTGKSVVRAYQACRSRHGWKGSCGSAAGYSCSRRILDSSSVQYDARVTCSRGSKRVVHTYTQNR